MDFLANNTAPALHDVRTETDRSWPGQAVAYKLGELKIRELRNRRSRRSANASGATERDSITKRSLHVA